MREAARHWRLTVPMDYYAGRAHQKILETISTQDAENLLAYPLTL